MCGLPDRRLEAAVAHGFAVLCRGLGGAELDPAAFRLPPLSEPDDLADAGDEFDPAAFAQATGSRLSPAPRTP